MTLSALGGGWLSNASQPDDVAYFLIDAGRMWQTTVYSDAPPRVSRISILELIPAMETT